MTNLLVSFGLCTFLAVATSAAKTQAAESGSACQQENSAFTYEHPTLGKFIDLTQGGLEIIKAEAGESTTAASQMRKCPEAKVGLVSSLKSWFKEFTSQKTDAELLYPDMTEEEAALYARVVGRETNSKSTAKGYWAGDPRANPVHLVKNGAFEAAVYMTQDGEKLLSNQVKNGDLKNTVNISPGESVEALLLFRGCSRNEHEKCLVTADYVIEAPDGSIFHEQLNTDVWKEPMQPGRQLSLTNTRVGFLAPDDADTGAYKFLISVYDKVSSKKLSLAGYVGVYKDLPENSRKAESGVQNLEYSKDGMRVVR